MKTPTAAQINEAAKKTAHMGYAGQAYISDVAAELGTTPAAITRLLNDLNRDGEIKLQRADLVPAMDARKVQASEIGHHLLKTVANHFVIVK